MTSYPRCCDDKVLVKYLGDDGKGERWHAATISGEVGDDDDDDDDDDGDVMAMSSRRDHLGRGRR